MPPQHLLGTPKTSLNAPPIPRNVLTLSRKVDECKPLHLGLHHRDVRAVVAERRGARAVAGRGLHSSPSQLNLSHFSHSKHPLNPNTPSTPAVNTLSPPHKHVWSHKKRLR